MDWNIIIPVLLMRKLRLWKMKACTQAHEVGILSWLLTYFLKHTTAPSSHCPDSHQHRLSTVTAPPLPVSASSFIPVHTSQLWPLSSLLKTVSGFSLPTDKVQTLSHVFKTLYHLFPMYICLYPYFHSSLLCMFHSQPQFDCRSLWMLHMSPHGLFLCLFSPLLPSLSSSLLLSLGITSKTLLCPPRSPWVDFVVPPQGFHNPLLWPLKHYSTGVWLPEHVPQHEGFWDHLCCPRPHSGPDPRYVPSKYLLDG